MCATACPLLASAAMRKPAAAGNAPRPTGTCAALVAAQGVRQQVPEPR